MVLITVHGWFLLNHKSMISYKWKSVECKANNCYQTVRHLLGITNILVVLVMYICNYGSAMYVKEPLQQLTLSSFLLEFC